MSQQWEYDLQNAPDSPVWKGNDEPDEEQEELSPCCDARIIHGDLCSNCYEHI